MCTHEAASLNQTLSATAAEAALFMMQIQTNDCTAQHLLLPAFIFQIFACITYLYVKQKTEENHAEFSQRRFTESLILCICLIGITR
jgi:hypothetical protein